MYYHNDQCTAWSIFFYVHCVISDYENKCTKFANWPWLLCTITDIVFQPPIGFSIATSIRVGNELGAGNPNAAKKASYLAVVCVCKYALNCVHT